MYDVLKKDFLSVPTTETDWIQIAQDFDSRWNFPMCIGGLDGKHIKISPPPGTGSAYYNYKGDFSIVLLALVNCNLEFLYVDVGTNGRISDGGVWSKSSFKAALESGKLNIPKFGVLPKTSSMVPYVIVADDAFPLSNNIMKPYPGRSLTEEKIIFNYRLSRARRVSENAFGILAARFQIYKKPITTTPEKVKKIVLATCVLHNFLKKRSENIYAPKTMLDCEDTNNCTISHGAYHQESSSMIKFKKMGKNPSESAKAVQMAFCNYFNSVGSVPWQKEMCKLH